LPVTLPQLTKLTAVPLPRESILSRIKAAGQKTLDKCDGVSQHVIMRHVVEDTVNKRKPLSEPVVLILASLAQEPRHGYALLTDVEKLSEGRVCLSIGTLYGAIRRLLEDGWIERFRQEDTTRDKQAYSLTKAGRRALESEIIRLRHLVQSTAMRLRQKEL
jgi:DNA-binding PadR family transcriptional regulator